jgi:hypothetical protein
LQRRTEHVLDGLAVVSILVLILSLLLVIVIWAIRRLEPKPPSDAEASFDPDSCARVMEVGCVYKIRPEAGNPLAQWFATAQGLYRHEKATGRFTRYGADHGLPSERVYDVCSEGARVWAATRGGCVRLEAGSGRFAPLRRDWKESDHPCELIEYFKGQGVFAALDGGGLFRIRSPDSLPVQVMIPDRNTNIRITCLKTLGNTLFIGQEDGFLYSFNPLTGAWRGAVFAPRLRSGSFIWDVSFHGGVNS